MCPISISYYTSNRKKDAGFDFIISFNIIKYQSHTDFASLVCDPSKDIQIYNLFIASRGYIFHNLWQLEVFGPAFIIYLTDMVLKEIQSYERFQRRHSSKLVFHAD